MKDKIITLNGKEKLYVVEELNHNNKKYILAAAYNEEKDELDESKISILKVTLENDKLMTEPATNEEIVEVGPILYKKVQENEYE